MDADEEVEGESQHFRIRCCEKGDGEGKVKRYMKRRGGAVQNDSLA